MDHGLILSVSNSIHCAEDFAITSMPFEQKCIRKWFSRVKFPLLEIDYCPNPPTTPTLGIWISFFDTEEAHAVMLAYAANGGPVDHRSSGPGSSGKSKLKARAQFGAKKDIHIPCHCRVALN
jgi:hypothetical protein